MKTSRWPDLLGMVAALGCALHCAILTALFLLYPALWLNRRYWEMGLWQKLAWLEWTLLASSWLLIALAMVPGWRRHRRPGPGLLAAAAAGLLTLVILSPVHNAASWTGAVALAAGIGIAVAHAWNLRLR